MASRVKARKGAPPSPPEAEAEVGPADPGSLVAIARGLAELVSEHNLTELILDTRDVTLTVRRGAPGGTPMPMPQLPSQGLSYGFPGFSAAPASPAGAGSPAAGGVASVAAVVAAEDKHHTVTSPFVGTFYRRPNPDSANYVALNDRVDKGQVLCIIEAMKLMNEIEADLSGTVVGILVEDGAPVEYGQPLFKIAP